MNDCYVYGLFRPDTGQIFYVGMGRTDRAYQHQKGRRKGRSHKDNIICKLIDQLGYAEIPVVFFREGISRQEAIDLEIALIYAIGRYPHGPLANIVRGGEGLADPTPAFRERHGLRMQEVLSDPAIRAVMSAKAKSRDRSGEWEQHRRSRMSDPKVRAKLRTAKLGKPSAKRGRKFPSDKAKAAQARLGWITNEIVQTRVPKDAPIPDGWRRGKLPVTEAARENMRKATRPPLTDEHKAKLSKAAKGKPIPWFQTPEIRAKAERNRKGRIWINNSSDGKTILPSESVPEGWSFGRPPRTWVSKNQYCL